MYYYVVVCVADSLCYEMQNILSTYPVALSELLFNLLTDRLVPVHREEDKGTLEALRGAGGLTILDLLLGWGR